MANFDQLAPYRFAGGDMPFKNNGLTDIPANTGVILDPANDFGIVVPTAAGGVAGTIGVTVSVIPAGKTGPVQCYGAALMVAHGAITRGDHLQISDTAAHMGQAKTKGAGVEELGIAICSAADTDPVLALLSRSRCA